VERSLIATSLKGVYKKLKTQFLVSCGKREGGNKIISRAEKEEEGIVDKADQEICDEIPTDSSSKLKIDCAVKGMYNGLADQNADSSLINGILPITNKILREKTENLAKLECNELKIYMKMMMLKRINGGIKNESQWGQQLEEYLNKL
jgi:hypothetical protein